jgi:hypothetical protein
MSNQILLARDVLNSKLRPLDVDSNGALVVSHVDISTLATEASLAGLNSKVVVCDTSAVATEASLAGLNSKVVVCDTSALATEASLAVLNSKVDVCNTSAVAVNSCVLPSGASTSAEQVSQTAHLQTLSGAVMAGVVQVSSHPSTLYHSHTQIWTDENIAPGMTSNSVSLDLEAINELTVYGDSTATSGNIKIEVSHDDITFFHLASEYLDLNYDSGNFGKTFKCHARYLRLSKTNEDMGTETINAHISYKV